MSERVVVPEFLSRAACDALLRTNHLSNPHQQGERIAEAICHALSEHPIVPTDEQLREMFPSVSHGVITHVMRWWAPRMFRAPEPEADPTDPIEFLFQELLDTVETLQPTEKDKIGHIRQQRDAYRRGLREKGQSNV